MLSLSFILLISLTCFSVQAKNLGQVHNVFDIKEERFLTMVQRKLKDVDLEQFNKDWQEKVKRGTKELKGQSIKRATEHKSQVVDMTYTLPKDLVSAEGDILHKAGTKVNPLDYMSLNYHIFVIDGQDNKQVEWIKAQKLNEDDMLILVKGSPQKLKEELKRDIYFDQLGEITNKFKIAAVPSVIKQVDKTIVVEEYAVD